MTGKYTNNRGTTKQMEEVASGGRIGYLYMYGGQRLIHNLRAE